MVDNPQPNKLVCLTIGMILEQLIARPVLSIDKQKYYCTIGDRRNLQQLGKVQSSKTGDVIVMMRL